MNALFEGKSGALALLATIAIMASALWVIGDMAKELRAQREILKQIHKMDCSVHYKWNVPAIKTIKEKKR